MGLTYNMVGGGKSLDPSDAILAVTAPSTSTVSASKNGLILTPNIWLDNLDNTINCALFIVPASSFDSSDWTITGSTSTTTASKTIVIDSSKEYELSLVVELTRLYLLKGNPIDQCTSITNGWVASPLRDKSWSYPQTSNGMYPTINTSGTYFKATCGHTWTGNDCYSGCVITGDSTNHLTNDLTGYTKIIINYDISLAGSTGQYYGINIKLFASKTWLTGWQNDAAYKTTKSHKNSATNQTITTSISGGGFIEVGVGINQETNAGSEGTITIKEIYAEP